MKISVATVVLTIGLSYLFMQFLGVGGLTLGMTVALTINFLVLMWLLRRKIGVIGFGRTGLSLLRVLGASAVMGAAGLGGRFRPLSRREGGHGWLRRAGGGGSGSGRRRLPIGGEAC